MRAFETYKHIKNTEVAMWPLTICYIPESKVYKAKCRWFNIVDPTHVYDTGVVDEVEIREEDLPNWEVYHEK